MAKKYNEIEVKDNMNISTDENNEEVAAPRERMKSVVDVKPQKVKRGLISRLVTGVAGPEGLPGIGAYVNEEIIKPAIKNIIVDAVTSGINMVMYGEKGGPPRAAYRPGTGSRPGHRPTVDYSTRTRHSTPEPLVARVSSRNSVPDFKIEDRIDASNVLVALTEAADRYDNVSVADYYDAIGVPSEYTDNAYGWTYDTISRATIVAVRGGYVIKFPPVEEI